MAPQLRMIIGLACIFCFVPNYTAAEPSEQSAEQWPHYGATLGGTRFATSEIITPATVNRMTAAWTFRTGDAVTAEAGFGRPSSFKATPVLIGNKLVFSTGFNRVIALHPESGDSLWRFDPQVDFRIKYSEMFTSRGIAAWTDPNPGLASVCHERIYLGTLDARLIAIDANTGKACLDFGTRGKIDLSSGIRNFRRGEYSVTSPPTVINDVVIVGSSIGDNGAAELESGMVRAFDARSGQLRWQWEPIGVLKADEAKASSGFRTDYRIGAANVWSVMSADADRDLVFLPTTSPSPDFYGGLRHGNNEFANSIVALRASTGDVIWTYQVVRHDLWDYDLAAQPMLVDIEIDGQSRPALVAATKMGLVFVLDRVTGKPIFPVAEQPVPQSSVPGEATAKTQRVPSIALHPLSTNLPRIWPHSAEHVATCEAMLENIRFEGIFTPPSLEGTMVYPGNPGGVNWGSMAVHPDKGIALVGVNRLPTVVKLIPRRLFKKAARNGQVNGFDAQFTAQSGTPYGMARYDLFNNQTGYHCLEGPWATLVAINLTDGSVRWEVPAGIAPGIDSESPAADWGHFVAGGPMVTAGGVVFLATPGDRMLRAYEVESGELLWQEELPAGAHATPMSYEMNGDQYVVVAAGGSVSGAAERGDFLVAYRVVGKGKPPLRRKGASSTQPDIELTRSSKCDSMTPYGIKTTR